MSLPKKTATEIIETFELQVNDVTELSTSEELGILNRVYQRISGSRPWEFLKTSVTGTILSDATSYYITLPDDFRFLCEDAAFTDNTLAYQGNSNPKVIFVTSPDGTLNPYRVVNYSDRRQYRNNSGIAYLDLAGNKIRFSYTPVYLTYDFDYVKKPAQLTANDYPVFPGEYHDMLAYYMAVENDILQLSEKARSYSTENADKANTDFKSMCYWNSMQYND